MQLAQQLSGIGGVRIITWNSKKCALFLDWKRRHFLLSCKVGLNNFKTKFHSISVLARILQHFVQRHIQNSVTHLRWSFFAKIAAFSRSLFPQKRPILDLWQGSKYTCTLQCFKKCYDGLFIIKIKWNIDNWLTNLFSLLLRFPREKAIKIKIFIQLTFYLLQVS